MDKNTMYMTWYSNIYIRPSLCNPSRNGDFLTMVRGSMLHLFFGNLPKSNWECYWRKHTCYLGNLLGHTYIYITCIYEWLCMYPWRSPSTLWDHVPQWPVQGWWLATCSMSLSWTRQRWDGQIRIRKSHDGSGWLIDD